MFRETCFWSMQNSRQGWKSYRETKGTYLSHVKQDGKKKNINSMVYMYCCRHLRGEDLDMLSLKELQSLEQQVDSSLKHIRSKKVRIVYKYWGFH